MTSAPTVVGVTVVAALALLGCGGSTPSASAPTSIVPPRAVTAGDELLAMLPAGAEIVVEIDLARLRGNPVVGDLLIAYLGDPALAVTPGMDPALGGALPAAPLAHADVVVLASYRVGTAQAATVSLLTGAELMVEDVPGAIELDHHVIALAPPELQAVLVAGDGGAATHLAGDDELMAVRARAMPARASGAALRVTARLSFDARVSLASQLDVEAAPATLSLWGDVADDLAVVAVADAPDVGGGAVGDQVGTAMAAQVEAWLSGLAAQAPVKALGLAPPLRAARVEAAGDRVQAVVLVGPQRLARAAARIRTYLTMMRERAAAAPTAP